MAANAGASSIASVITLGTNLATDLDINLSADGYPEKQLVALTSYVSSTAGILRQLHQFVEAHLSQSNQTTPTLKDAGYQALQLRVGQCEILYRTIIAIVTKAGAAGGKKKLKTEFIDTNRLKATTLSRFPRWRWLRPRVEKIQEQINVVKLNLLLILQVATLAKHQICTIQRVPGVFEVELALRSSVESLKRRTYCVVKPLAKRYKKRPPPSSASSSVTSLGGVEQVVITEEPTSKPIALAPNNSRIDGHQTEIAEVDKESGSKPPPYSEASLSIKRKSIFEPINAPWPPNHVPLPPPPPPPLPLPTIVKETTPGDFKEKLSPFKEAEVVETLVDKKEKEVEFITMSSFKKQFGKVDSWFKELFGPSSLFFDDKQSEDLEAFMILGNSKRLKVPFGHRRLKFGMKKLMKSKKESTLDEFYALPKTLHNAINLVLQGAKISDSRERVVVCFDVLSLGEKPEDQYLLMFLAANGPPLEPIHFNDAVGRKFDVPYHLVLTWAEMKQMVNEAFLHVGVIGPHVHQGHYDLVSLNGTIILPTCWEGTIKPGMKITMQMWPMDASKPAPLRQGPPPRPSGLCPSLFPRPRLGPGFGPPPPPPPGFGLGPPPPLPTGSLPGPNTLGGAKPILPRPPVVVRPPPPPPLPQYPIVILPKKKAPIKRRSYDTFTTYSSTDSSAFRSDSDIENEEGDAGIKFDFKEEKKNVGMSVKDLLVKWTNAIDVEGGSLSSSGWSSGSGSGSSSDDDD